MAREVVRTYYSKVLRIDAIYEDDEEPMLSPNQLEEYSFVRNNIKAVLKDGLFLIGGKDEQVSNDISLATSNACSRVAPTISPTRPSKSSV